MPRAHSYIDDDPDTFPLHVKLALDVDRSFRFQGRCRGANGQMRFAWYVMKNEKVSFGSSVYSGKELIGMALELCRACPVQWQCARYAVETAPYPTYIWGTWGADVGDLRWAKRVGERGMNVIDAAEAMGEPVQVALRQARKTRAAA